MKFTQIPNDTFQKLQMNAGILVKGFTPGTGTITDIIGATTGGVSFSDSVTYSDMGEDIDNAPKNTKELKKIDSHEVRMSGTFVTIDADTLKLLMGSADTESAGHIVPRNEILQADFTDVWWIGDYSDVNTDSGQTQYAGFLAIHLMNALNTGGFQIQTADKSKGNFAFDFMGHYSINAQDTVPYEIYIKAGVQGA